MPVDEKGNDLPPGPQERGDALNMIKEYARKGFMQSGAGTKEDFEELWRTAFGVESVEPSSEY
jgi:hypothetical protein